MGLWGFNGTNLFNGEVVLIKQTGFDYDGAIYAVDWDGQTYIKKVYREEDGLRLVSLNKHYADKFAPYEHRSMYSYVRLSIDRCTATYV